MSVKHLRVTLLGTALCAFTWAGSASAKVISIDFETNLAEPVSTSLAAGTVIDDEYAHIGVQFASIQVGNTASTVNPVSPSPAMVNASKPLVLFNANCGASPLPSCTGGDTDLSFPLPSPGQGNILIINEDTDTTDPDDHAPPGGLMQVTFDKPVDLIDMLLGDLERSSQPAIITAYDENGNQIGQTEEVFSADYSNPPGNNGDNRLVSITFGVDLLQTYPNDSTGVTTSIPVMNDVTYLQVRLKGSGTLAGFRFAVPEPSTLALLAIGLLGAGVVKRRRLAA